MITHAASRKHYYTVLLDRTLGCSFVLHRAAEKDIIASFEKAEGA